MGAAWAPPRTHTLRLLHPHARNPSPANARPRPSACWQRGGCQQARQHHQEHVHCLNGWLPGYRPAPLQRSSIPLPTALCFVEPSHESLQPTTRLLPRSRPLVVPSVFGFPWEYLKLRNKFRDEALKGKSWLAPKVQVGIKVGRPVLGLGPLGQWSWVGDRCCSIPGVRTAPVEGDAASFRLGVQHTSIRAGRCSLGLVQRATSHRQSRASPIPSSHLSPRPPADQPQPDRGGRGQDAAGCQQ